MANLSNINNKFLVTTGGNVLIGQTTAVGTPIFQVAGNSRFSGEIRTANRLAIKETYFGYSSGYKVIQVGESAATKSISLGYDPINNTNGGFSGNEILIPNNIRILAPNAADNLFYGVMLFNSSNKLLIGSSNYLMESNYIMALDPATKNVGIGTDSPTSKLHLRDPGVNSDVGIKIGNDSRDWNLKVMGSVSDSLQFFTHDNSNVMTILPSGNVGIGTTAPNNPLTVAGNLLVTTTVGDGQEDRFKVVGGGSGDDGNVYVYNDTQSATIRLNSGGASYFTNGLMVGYTSGSYKVQVLEESTNTTNIGVYTNIRGAGTNNYAFYADAANGTSTNFGFYGNSGKNAFLGDTGIGTDSPTQKLDVDGQMTHGGLVLKTGTSVYIDTIQTINKTLSITGATWTNTGIEGTDIGANGSYMIQVYSNAFGATGGAWYSMYWTGVMSWYKDSTNGVNVSEIYLNFSGHALNSNVLQLRTVQHTSGGSPANLMSLQIKTVNTLTNAPISFRFRRLM